MNTHDIDIEKAALKGKIDDQIEKANSEIERLRSIAPETSADTRHRINLELQALQQKREEAKREVKRIRTATHETWGDLRCVGDGVWQTLSDAVGR